MIHMPMGLNLRTRRRWPVAAVMVAAALAIVALPTLRTLVRHHILAPLLHRALRALDQVGWVPQRTTTYLGHPFIYPFDSMIGRAIARGEEWDTALGTIMPALLPMDNPLICDVGSNIGASLLQIMKAKPAARVVAFEPSARFLPFLKRNVELAGAGEVEIVPLALGKQRGTLQLYTNATSSSAIARSYGQRPRRKELVAMTTLDDVFRLRAGVDFIKVDADGLDLAVLRGAEEVLRRDAPILYFELFPTLLAIADAVAGLSWLRSLGYRSFACIGGAQGAELLGQCDDPETCLALAEATICFDALACCEGTPAYARFMDLVARMDGPGVNAQSN